MKQPNLNEVKTKQSRSKPKKMTAEMLKNISDLSSFFTFFQ